VQLFGRQVQERIRAAIFELTDAPPVEIVRRLVILGSAWVVGHSAAGEKRDALRLGSHDFRDRPAQSGTALRPWQGWQIRVHENRHHGNVPITQDPLEGRSKGMSQYSVL